MADNESMKTTTTHAAVFNVRGDFKAIPCRSSHWDGTYTVTFRIFGADIDGSGPTEEEAAADALENVGIILGEWADIVRTSGRVAWDSPQ